MTQTSVKLKIKFQKAKGMQDPLKLVEMVFADLKEFKKHLPLVRVFSNRGIKERHWEEISQIVGFNVRPEKKEVLNRLIGMNLTDAKYSTLEDISESASKEFSIEKILDKMMGDWKDVFVELKEWKDSGTFVVTGVSIDEVLQILDDQIIKTLTMKGSPYAKIFEERISAWEDWLQYTQVLFEYWVKVQSVWLYLEPIFSSPDITKHLPMEAEEFKKVDDEWKNQIMGKIFKEPRVIEFS